MKVKYGQNTIIDDAEKTSVTLRTSKKMLEYDLQIQASSGGGNVMYFLPYTDLNFNYDIDNSGSPSTSDFLIFEKKVE